MATISMNTYTAEVFKTNLLNTTVGLVWKNTTEAKNCETADNVYLADLFIAANRGMLTFEVVRQFPQEIIEACGVTDDNKYAYVSDKTKIPKELRPKVVAMYQDALKSINPYTGHPGYPITTTEYESTLNPDTQEYELTPIKVTKYISFFDDQNNYYRMLNGLPNYEDTDYIYNTDEHWDTKTPIHLMNIIDRVEMESKGVLQKYIDANPTKKYLKFLGKKQIGIYEARVAERFGILWINGSSSNNLVSDFMDVYEAAKNQVNAVYYSDAFRRTNDLYENFLAMCVLFMAIQTMAHRYLGVDVTRDFYDTESIKYVYDSYSVPFYNEIPLDYHRKIIKAINRLIGYKGSNKVFYDLFGIFDMAQMQIYSYYLTKRRRFGADGKPVFIYKTEDGGASKDLYTKNNELYFTQDNDTITMDANIIYDEDGNPILDPASYDIGFVKVPVDADPALGTADPENWVSKAELSDLDPYWVEDDNLKNKLDSEMFNFTESKYIGVQTMLDLMKITYENAYLFKMLTDNKEITDSLTFRWPDMDITVSIYDCIIYTACIYCRVYGYTGEIQARLPFIGTVLGYDFQEDLEKIQKDITDNEWTRRLELYLDPEKAAESKHDDSDLINLILNMNITDMKSVSKVFENMNAISDFLINRYMNAKSLEEYYAYKHVYDELLTSKHVREGLMVYRDPYAIYYLNTNDERMYQTYADSAPIILDEEDATAVSFFTLLEDTCPQLAARLATLTDSELQSELQVIVDKIEELIDSIRYLPFSVGLDTSNMLDSLLKILKFFKSAKAELVGYNIIYTISARGLNFIKFLDKIKSWENWAKYDSDQYLMDHIRRVYYKEKMVGDETSIIKMDSIDLRYYMQKFKEYPEFKEEFVIDHTINPNFKRDEILPFDTLKTTSQSAVMYRSKANMTDKIWSADGREL